MILYEKLLETPSLLGEISDKTMILSFFFFFCEKSTFLIESNITYKDFNNFIRKFSIQQCF